MLRSRHALVDRYCQKPKKGNSLRRFEDEFSTGSLAVDDDTAQIGVRHCGPDESAGGVIFNV
jgi:hypothetical protein